MQSIIVNLMDSDNIPIKLDNKQKKEFLQELQRYVKKEHLTSLETIPNKAKLQYFDKGNYFKNGGL